MRKTKETYYCDVCGKEMDDKDVMCNFEKPMNLPFRKPFKDDNGQIISYTLYDNYYVKDICTDCHCKIAKFISSLIPEEMIGHDGSYRGD